MLYNEVFINSCHLYAFGWTLRGSIFIGLCLYFGLLHEWSGSCGPKKKSCLSFPKLISFLKLISCIAMVAAVGFALKRSHVLFNTCTIKPAKGIQSKSTYMYSNFSSHKGHYILFLYSPICKCTCMILQYDMMYRVYELSKDFGYHYPSFNSTVHSRKNPISTGLSMALKLHQGFKPCIL